MDSGGLIGQSEPVLARGESRNLFKRRGKITLVGESAFQGDIAEGHVGIPHEPDRVLNPALAQVGAEPDAGFPLENCAQIGRGNGEQAGSALQRVLIGMILLYIFPDGAAEAVGIRKAARVDGGENLLQQFVHRMVQGAVVGCSFKEILKCVDTV